MLSVLSHGKQLSVFLHSRLNLSATVLLNLSENDSQQKMMRFGVIIPIYKDFFELSDKTETSEGTVWTLSIESEDAEALIFYSDNFKMPRTGKFYMYNEDKTKILGAFTYRNNSEFNLPL